MFRQLFLARRFKKEIDIALADDPKDIQAQRDLMEFYLLAPVIAGGDIALAQDALSGVRRDDALSELQAREALKIDSKRVAAYAILASVDAARGDWAEMDAMLARAEAEVPDDLTPCYRAAESVIAAHREPARAERLLHKYLAAEPEGNAPTREDAERLLATLLR